MTNKRISFKKERMVIDQVDRQIALLLLRRFKICQKIASRKKEAGFSLMDKEREKAILKNVSKIVPLKYGKPISDIFVTILLISKKIANL